jgi:eukaryotic-like serine/threonine-protein kinase
MRRHEAQTLSFAAGFRVGSFEIRDALGVRGMGEVYRARDTKLHRDVALKILPERFAADPGSRRFSWPKRR